MDHHFIGGAADAYQCAVHQVTEFEIDRFDQGKPHRYRQAKTVPLFHKDQNFMLFSFTMKYSLRFALSFTELLLH